MGKIDRPPLDGKSLHANLEKAGKKNSTKTKKYTPAHRTLFMAIFEGSANINPEGKIQIGNKVTEFNFADPDVQHFIDKSRRMKKYLEGYMKTELENMFGKL